MAEIYSGYKRSLKCYVSKKLDNILAEGYPKQYPTATDIVNGYFTYNAVQYDIPTQAELATMSQLAYDSLLATFKLYVEAIESGSDFDTDTLVQPTIYDPTGQCSIGSVTTTTTTEAESSTTTEFSPETAYTITSDGEGYSASQTNFEVTGGQINDILTMELKYSGTIQRNSGFISTRARAYALYPGGYSMVLSPCYNNSLSHEFDITKVFNITIYADPTVITTEISKINSSNESGEITLAITNINRGGTNYPINEIAAGKHYKSVEPQFSC